MDFEHSQRVKDLQARLTAFMDEHVYPNEARFFAEVAANKAQGNGWVPTRVMEEMKARARAAGLWLIIRTKTAPPPPTDEVIHCTRNTAPDRRCDGRASQCPRERHRGHSGSRLLGP